MERVRIYKINREFRLNKFAELDRTSLIVASNPVYVRKLSSFLTVTPDICTGHEKRDAMVEVKLSNDREPV